MTERSNGTGFTFSATSEQRKLERQFEMGSGHTLNFTRRALAEFIEEHTGRDGYAKDYPQRGSTAWTLRNQTQDASSGRKKTHPRLVPTRRAQSRLPASSRRAARAVSHVAYDFFISSK